MGCRTARCVRPPSPERSGQAGWVRAGTGGRAGRGVAEGSGGLQGIFCRQRGGAAGLVRGSGGARSRRTHRAGRRRAPAALPAGSEMSGRDPPPRRLKGTGPPPPTAPGAGPERVPRTASPAGKAGRAWGPSDPPHSALRRLRSPEAGPPAMSGPQSVSEGQSREYVHVPSAAVPAAPPGPLSAAATPRAPGARPDTRPWPGSGPGTAREHSAHSAHSALQPRGSGPRRGPAATQGC